MSFEKSNATNSGNQVSFEKSKLVKFWKSKVSFEKSNATNFGNQSDKVWKSKVSFAKSKVLFEKSNAINFGNQKCHLKNQRRLILEIESVN